MKSHLKPSSPLKPPCPNDSRKIKLSFPSFSFLIVCSLFRTHLSFPPPPTWLSNLVSSFWTSSKWRKSCPATTCRAWGGGGRQVWLPFIIDLGTRWGWMVSVTPRARCIPGKGPPVPIGQEGGWAGLDTEATGKILSLCGDRTPVVQSVVGHYTNWATQATSTFNNVKRNTRHLILLRCLPNIWRSWGIAPTHRWHRH
jgi:hypothetical protein